MIDNAQKPNSSLNRNSINVALAEHQERSDWIFAKQSACLKRWYDRFNAEFDLRLEVPAIAIKPLPRTRYAHYCPVPNWFGLDHEIAFNLRFLPGRPPSEVLGTLLHEVLHLWQQLFGTPGSGNYHNVEFQRKSAVLGLIIDKRGVTELAEAPSPFFDLIDKHQDDLADLDFTGHPLMEKQTTRMRKWSCSCPSPINIRCAVELRATCNLCGQQFVRR